MYRNVFEKLMQWLYSQQPQQALNLSVRAGYPQPKQHRAQAVQRRHGQRFLSLRARSNRRKAR